MEDVQKLLKSTVEELDKLLNAKNVLAAPIEKDGATIIPLVAFGFGFGAGGGDDAKKGHGGGAGAGGGVKPIGAVIVDAEGARIEAVKGAMSGLAEAIARAASKAMDRAAEDDAPTPTAANG